MFKKLLALSLLVCFVALITGCASIIHGKLQKISVNTAPSGANVEATSGEGDPVRCTTPGVLELDRSRPGYVLHIEKVGYKDIDVVLKRGIDPWFWGNIIIGGIIGIMVDMSSGSAYKFSPSQIDEFLKKEGIDTSRLDISNKAYIFVALREDCTEFDVSELQKIN